VTVVSPAAPTPRPIVHRHPCPAPGCRASFRPGFVGCRDHWLLVPYRDRERLAPRFRLRESDPKEFALAVAEARDLIVKYAGEWEAPIPFVAVDEQPASAVS
jgi:hypothetical protein